MYHSYVNFVDQLNEESEEILNQEVTEAKDVDEKGDSAEYKAFFTKALKKFGVKSPDELKGDKEKEFYDYVDKNWKADNEEPEPEDEEVKEAKDVDKKGDSAEYKALFQKALKKYNVKSPKELDGDKEKSFYDYIDKNWKGDDEKPEPEDEEVKENDEETVGGYEADESQAGYESWYVAEDYAPVTALSLVEDYKDYVAEDDSEDEDEESDEDEDTEEKEEK